MPTPSLSARTRGTSRALLRDAPSQLCVGCRARTPVVKPMAFVREQQSSRDKQAELLSRKGYAVQEKKAPLSMWTYEAGPIRDMEVDIRVTHNGVCHSDLHMRDDDWGISKYPFVPGHEVVGEVVAVGTSVTGLRPGDRVGVGWIKDSCRHCAACLRGEENVCVKGYTGLIVNGGNGGFQQIMRAPAAFTYRIPDGLDSAAAAPLLCAGITVYAPLRRHITYPGAKVAILGVGGLGHLALQYANKMGAEVTALDVWADKEQEAHNLGAHAFHTWESATKSEGLQGYFDLVLNCASGSINTAQLMSLLRNNGSLVQVGIPGGNAVMQTPLQDLVFGQKKVAGSIVGGRADMQEMLEFSGIHGIKPMLEIMPLSQVNEAMKRVAEGKARYRIVLTSDWE